MSLSLVQRRECSLCREYMDRSVDLVSLQLFGWVALAICPSCRLPVDESTLKDRNYRRRARRFYARKEEPTCPDGTG
jgi:hypothetical protein